MYIYICVCVFLCVHVSTKKDYKMRAEIPLGINLSIKMGLILQGSTVRTIARTGSIIK